MSVTKETKENIIKNFGGDVANTGSTEVQIALLTSYISDISEHLKTHPKDFASKRGLLQLIARRRIFLRYVEKQSKARYKNIIERLALRK